MLIDDFLAPKILIVSGKGGVGKTTVSASIGSVFAELRQDDRVVAIDADTAFGKLGSRVDPNAQGSYWELASDQHLESFADVRSRVGNNAAGLFVLAGEGSPARRRVLDPAIYREERWAFPDGRERRIYFFELVGDTLWGATAAMLRQLLGMVTGTLGRGDLGHP